jgi:hypothetical protein
MLAIPSIPFIRRRAILRPNQNIIFDLKVRPTRGGKIDDSEKPRFPCGSKHLSSNKIPGSYLINTWIGS